jgi:hypothetical protein
MESVQGIFRAPINGVPQSPPTPAMCHKDLELQISLHTKTKDRYGDFPPVFSTSFCADFGPSRQPPPTMPKKTF